MKPLVIQCSTCKRVSRFGKMVEPPTELVYDINAGERDVREIICEECKPPVCASNRLLPVRDKNEDELSSEYFHRLSTKS